MPSRSGYSQARREQVTDQIMREFHGSDWPGLPSDPEKRAYLVSMVVDRGIDPMAEGERLMRQPGGIPGARRRVIEGVNPQGDIRQGDDYTHQNVLGVDHQNRQSIHVHGNVNINEGGHQSVRTSSRAPSKSRQSKESSKRSFADRMRSSKKSDSRKYDSRTQSGQYDSRIEDSRSRFSKMLPSSRRSRSKTGNYSSQAEYGSERGRSVARLPITNYAHDSTRGQSKTGSHRGTSRAPSQTPSRYSRTSHHSGSRNNSVSGREHYSYTNRYSSGGGKGNSFGRAFEKLGKHANKYGIDSSGSGVVAGIPGGPYVQVGGRPPSSRASSKHRSDAGKSSRRSKTGGSKSSWSKYGDKAGTAVSSARDSARSWYSRRSGKTGSYVPSSSRDQYPSDFRRSRSHSQRPSDSRRSRSHSQRPSESRRSRSVSRHSQRPADSYNMSSTMPAGSARSHDRARSGSRHSRSSRRSGSTVRGAPAAVSGFDATTRAPDVPKRKRLERAPPLSAGYSKPYGRSRPSSVRRDPRTGETYKEV